MTRLTIEVPDDVAERVAVAAAERGVAPEQLAGEVVADRFPPRRTLGFVGLGHSGRSDLTADMRRLRREAAEKKLADMADDRGAADG